MSDAPQDWAHEKAAEIVLSVMPLANATTQTLIQFVAEELRVAGKRMREERDHYRDEWARERAVVSALRAELAQVRAEVTSRHEQWDRDAVAWERAYDALSAVAAARHVELAQVRADAKAVQEWILDRVGKDARRFVLCWDCRALATRETEHHEYCDAHAPVDAVDLPIADAVRRILAGGGA